MVIIEDWIAQRSNLKKQCEQIRGVFISDRTWRNWERLCGAVYNQGQKINNRKYTDEETQLLLCLAWLRKHYPRVKVTYKSLRNYWLSNTYKIEEVFDACCKGNKTQQEPKTKSQFIALSQVKKYCDAIINRPLSRNCWAKWKQYLGIKKHTRFVESGQAALLTFMACWRHDNPTQPFPSVNRLLVMMEDWSRTAMSLETASSAKMWHQWRMQGCRGKDLHKYLQLVVTKFASALCINGEILANVSITQLQN
ncbi:MAG: hypothetical protein QNJ47_12555 [Nostocaceae cyanobacterium]|nr:hypothetical protein [Nostocaceae cyanobacterium]